jgi:hypothetical protein
MRNIVRFIVHIIRDGERIYCVKWKDDRDACWVSRAEFIDIGSILIKH